MCSNSVGRQPSLKGFFSNWKTNRARFPSKIRMAVRNNLIKIIRRQSCCGNYDQVGC